jgi:hypothetical protein
MTTLFRAKIQFGQPTPDDDIEELRWFDVNKLSHDTVVPEHLPLMAMLFPHWHTIS